MSSVNKREDDYSPSTVPYTGGGAVKANGQWIPSTKAVGDTVKDQTGQAQQHVAGQHAGSLRIQNDGAINVPTTAPEASRQSDAPASVPIHASAGRNNNVHHSSESTVFHREPAYPAAIVGMPNNDNSNAGVTTRSCLEALRNLNRKMERSSGGQSSSSKVGAAARPFFQTMKELDAADEPSESGDSDMLTMKPRKKSAKHHKSIISSTVAEAGDMETVPKATDKKSSTISPKGPLGKTIRHKALYNGNFPYPYTPQVSPEDSPYISPSASMSSIPADATTVEKAAEEKPAEGKLRRVPTPVPSSIADPRTFLLHGNMDDLDIIIRSRLTGHPLEFSTIWQRRPAAPAAPAAPGNADDDWELVENPEDDDDEWDDCGRALKA